MSEQRIEYEITDVGGVAHAKLTLEPGVNILRGRKAAGKTSAARAIARAAGGTVKLEKRDGTGGGVVRGPGVTLHVAGVTNSTGEAELELADVSPLATLIDPGFRDPKANARARIRALTELLAVQVTDERVDALCQGDEELASWLRETLQAEAEEDLLEASEKLRNKAHAEARIVEDLAEQHGARADAAAERGSEILGHLGPAYTETAVADAKAEYEERFREHVRAEEWHGAKVDLEEEQKAIRATLGERPDVEAAEARENQLVQDRECELRDIRKLESKLAILQDRFEQREIEVDGAVVARRATEEAAKSWDESKKILDEKPSGPDRDDVEAALRARNEAALTLDRAARSDDYRCAESERQEQEGAGLRQKTRARFLRALADEIPSRLGTILAEAGAPGLTVVEGRLAAVRDGNTVDFEFRLSDGERVTAALDLALHAYGTRLAVPLGKALWNELDFAGRQQFGQLAAERGLYLLTEESTEGDLHVETIGATDGRRMVDEESGECRDQE